MYEDDREESSQEIIDEEDQHEGLVAQGRHRGEDETGEPG